MSDTDKRANQALLLTEEHLEGVSSASRYLPHTMMDGQGVLTCKKFLGTSFWKSIAGTVVKMWSSTCI